ncbi:NnrU family protein [Microbaculum marinum]|uniref:NnrU family protein n=1 Tax=Microbaculum marinum TaxID=1764581 RepID=A0AAW9RQ69_9HYPH
MAQLLLAILLFLTAHVVPPAPPVRRRLIALLGRRGYLLAYSVLSLALLVWIVITARSAPYMALWSFAPWQSVIPVVAMPLAFWFVVAGLAEPNPLSISLRRRNPTLPLAPIVVITRHPVLWGFLIWAGAHLPPNGDIVSLILFGGMAALAAAGMPLLDRRARARLGDERWKALSRGTSVLPFLAIASRNARIRFSGPFMLHTAISLAAYLWFLLQGHRLLIGPDPLSLLPW